MRTIATLTFIVSVLSSGNAAAGDQDTKKTIELRGGALTLNALCPVENSWRAVKYGRRFAAYLGILDELQAPDRPLNSRYVLLEFDHLLQPADYTALEAKGIRILSYLTGTTYTAVIGQTNTKAVFDAAKDINYCARLGEYGANNKIDDPLKTLKAAPQFEPVILNVELWPDANFEAFLSEAEKLGVIKDRNPYTKRLQVEAKSASVVDDLARNDAVKFVSIKKRPVPHNTHVRKSVQVDVIQDAQPELAGTSIKVGVFDEAYVAKDHPSFRGRHSIGAVSGKLTFYRSGDHATHVAGIIAGSGEYQRPTTSETGAPPATEDKLPLSGEQPAFNSQTVAGEPASHAADSQDGDKCRGVPPLTLERRYPGIAPSASIVSYEFSNAQSDLSKVLVETPDAIDISHNSWGEDVNEGLCNDFGAYTFAAGPYDDLISGHLASGDVRRIPVVFSVGNLRNKKLCGLKDYRTITPPATAKNVISVGAVDADGDAVAEFSDFGPTRSGRLKPDVVAPGCRCLGGTSRGIISAVPETGLGGKCGTSQAAPVVSGLIALLMQRIEQLDMRKTEVYPSTYKALLIHGAQDLGAPGPDFATGYGKVRLPTSLALVNEHRFLQGEFNAQTRTNVQNLMVPQGAAEVKVTLVWDDLPKDNQVDTLTSDLDLSLVSPSKQSFLPWVLDPTPGKEASPAQRGPDHINVVEQVSVANPEAGEWKAVVKATGLANLKFAQTYSLVMTAK